MSDQYSNRHKKRVIQEGVRALKNKPGWDVSSFVPASARAQERLMELDQQARDQKVYAQSERCQGCETLREQSGDASALCETHLAEAMGF
ncbi:hypothetical protein DL240_16890 [Lujinxingia litoralis]|uniref:Uncharacterized protein n=1 Tax=Lujinxingia litoralis TaxID=2211119 RepID=A0A328C3S8_9DELT|nr:hypothetical protein [Lujinxingia litoralis]RAL20481.1 hypothetical protein DL240_16890 [Lujinxingia litoralis]